MKNWKLPFALLLMLSTCWLACKKDAILPTDDAIVSVTFAGRVVGPNDQPIVGAEVSAGTAKTNTDVNGVFRLPEQSLPSRNAILRVQQTGFFEFSRAYIVENKSVQNLTIQLLGKKLIHSFAATQSTTAQTGGAQINFPANAVARADGSAYTGVVSVFSQYLDPTAADLNRYMPGDLRGIATDGTEQTLASYGMIGVELTTPGGEPLNIAPGQEVEINLPIPSEKLSTAPATIPLWHYDNETARWIEEGSAQKVGDRYVGKVTHFSFWNYDAKFPLVRLDGKVYLGNNEQPLQFATVRLTILSSGWFSYGGTDGNGCFGGSVPYNEAMLMEVLINSDCGNTVVYSQTIGPFQNDAVLPPVVVQPVNMTMLTISGKLLDCNQQGLQNGYARIELGGSQYQAFPASDGSFELTVPHCNNEPVNVVGYDLDALMISSTATFTNAVSPLAVGDIQVCTNLSEFIEIIFDGQSSLFLENITFIQEADWTTIFSEGDNRFVSFSFASNQQTGTFPLEYFELFPGADSLSNINMNTTVSQFGPQIIGTISGTAQSFNGQTHNISGSYQVEF